MDRSGPRTFPHNLDTDPDHLVVDQQFKDKGSSRAHHRGYGGNSLYFGGLQRYGAHWQGLTGQVIEVYRQAGHGFADEGPAFSYTPRPQQAALAEVGDLFMCVLAESR